MEGPGLPAAHPQPHLQDPVPPVRGLQKWGWWGAAACGDRLARGVQQEAPLGPWC